MPNNLFTDPLYSNILLFEPFFLNKAPDFQKGKYTQIIFCDDYVTKFHSIFRIRYCLVFLMSKKKCMYKLLWQ